MCVQQPGRSHITMPTGSIPPYSGPAAVIFSTVLANATIEYFFSYYIQWNPSITDTLGTQNFVRYNEVSLSQGLLVYFR